MYQVIITIIINKALTHCYYIKKQRAKSQTKLKKRRDMYIKLTACVCFIIYYRPISSHYESIKNKLHKSTTSRESSLITLAVLTCSSILFPNLLSLCYKQRIQIATTVIKRLKVIHIYVYIYIYIYCLST